MPPQGPVAIEGAEERGLKNGRGKKELRRIFGGSRSGH